MMSCTSAVTCVITVNDWSFTRAYFCSCRRQVFWISKQILQLMMEDAIDDWLLTQIHWLRREDTIASGIRWLKDVSTEPIINIFILLK